MIKERSFKKGTFKLASGKTSSYYFNLKSTYCHPAGSALIGDLVLQIIEANKLNVDTIGGMELGAVPIACAVQARGFFRNKPMNIFIVRKEKKDHGTQSLVEGNIEKGQNVIIVEDVTTTGGSAMKAVDAVKKEYDANVAAVISVVNRKEGADELFAEKGIPFYSVSSIEEYDEELKKAK
jgi:orotate phosphoribosyltransferase